MIDFVYDPIMRVLTVLEILQSRDHVSGEELAERLEVSPRTVQRYIARLQDLSVPVEGTRGVGGAYRLKPGFRMPPLLFTDEEAFALTLGLKALRHLGLSAFAPATEGAAAKLGRVLPEALRQSVEAMDGVIALEPGPWVVSTPADFLIRVSTAIRTRRRITFEYQSHAGANSKRGLEPYGVAHLDGRWYLVGRCLQREALRTFRLDRTARLELGTQTFARPTSFDVKAYLEKSMPFVQSAFSITVWLDLPYRKACNYFELHRMSITEETAGITIRCGRDELHAFAAMLLGLGCRIVVHEPAALRETFRTISQAAREAAGDGLS